MTVYFNDHTEVEEVSLACKLGIGPNVRWSTMASGIKLTHEENDAEYIQVHVAVPTRRHLVMETEDTPLHFGRLATA